jgi:hypothetical protein
VFTNDSPPLPDIADRILRTTLQHPTNLRAFLNEVLKGLATGFDYERARLAPRDFLLDDWRGREADLLFEIPYRMGEDERWALICVLIEHQTRADLRMPLRILIYAVLYWEREWRSWEAMAPPRPRFRLTPIIPIVLHTSSQAWGSARTLADLIDGPPQFGVFTPRWEPLFWELANQSSQKLLDSRHAFFQFLSVVRAEKAPPEEFEPIYVEAMRRLGRLHDTEHVLWTELLSAVLTWACSRRPGDENTRWQILAESAQENGQRKSEVRNMGKTIAHIYYEEGIEKGIEKGVEKGKLEGVQQFILHQGETRFGAPDESIQCAIRAINNLEQLQALGDRILVASGWSDLIKAP